MMTWAFVLGLVILLIFFSRKKTSGVSVINQDTKDLTGVMTAFIPSTKPGTRAFRNNNPGNLIYVGQKGASGSDKDGFCVFPTEDAGWQALYSQINLDKGRGHTLSSFMHKYAPPTENNTFKYIQFLMKELSIDDPGISLKEVDTKQLAVNIAKYEGYYA